MTTYRANIEASNADGDIWQVMHTETITTDQDPAELARDIAANQNIATGDGWRVRIHQVDAAGHAVDRWLVSVDADGTTVEDREELREELAQECERGALALEREAIAYYDDTARAAGKLAAAGTIRAYVAAYLISDRAGVVDEVAARMVARAGQCSGILIDPTRLREIRSPWSNGVVPTSELDDEHEAMRRLAVAGTFTHVAEPGQTAFYALAGWVPASPEMRSAAGLLHDLDRVIL